MTTLFSLNIFIFALKLKPSRNNFFGGDQQSLNRLFHPPNQDYTFSKIKLLTFLFFLLLFTNRSYFLYVSSELVPNSEDRSSGDLYYIILFLFIQSSGFGLMYLSLFFGCLQRVLFFCFLLCANRLCWYLFSVLWSTKVFYCGGMYIGTCRQFF